MRPLFKIQAAFAALTLILSGCNSPKVQSAGGPPPVPVSVATATQESVPVDIRAIGTVEPSSTVQVKSQIAGELMSVHFTEGGDVAKGALLFKIDPRPYQQALQQAESALTRDTAQLRQAEANLAKDVAQEKNARADAERYNTLGKEGLAPRSQSNQYQTAADAAHESTRADQAAIDSARASLESDRVAISKAKLDLSYCEIRSPISGKAGNLLIQPGNLIAVNGNPLVVINQIAPIFVSFGVPEEQLAAIRKRGTNKIPLVATIQNDPGKLAHGTLTVIDNSVDPATGTIKLKGTFSNQERILWPGLFVNVVLTLETRANAVLIQAEAVQAGQDGQFVYVVKPDHTVESRKVTVGQTVGGKDIIETGLTAGETVVIDGQLRLFPGAPIQAVPAGKIGS